MGLIFGAIFGLFFGFMFPSSLPEQMTILSILVGNVIFAVIAAGLYYFLFRARAANPSLDDRERTKFADLYFLWVGVIVGMEGTRLFFGWSPLDVVTTIIFVIVGLTIVYRKLFQLYRANPSGGAKPPTA